jgi:hypothetical protein
MPSLHESAKLQMYTILCNASGILGDCWKLTVPARDVVLLYGRLWVEDGEERTWVLAATEDPLVWNGIPGKLPDSVEVKVPIAGPEVHTVLRAKVLETENDNTGRMVWKRVYLRPTPVMWNGSDRPIYSSIDKKFGYTLVGEPEIDVIDNKPVCRAMYWGTTGINTIQWTDIQTMKVMCRTGDKDGTMVSEGCCEVDKSDFEYDDSRNEVLEYDGHNYEMTEVQLVAGVYLAVRQQE